MRFILILTLATAALCTTPAWAQRAPTPARATAHGRTSGHPLVGKQGKLANYRTAVARTHATGRSRYARRGCPANCSRCSIMRPAPPPQADDEPLAPRLLAALREGDLAKACRLARWAASSPRREAILRKAIFMQLPSPTLLQDAARRLRDEVEWQRHSGRDSLLRVLAGPHAKTA